MCVCVLASVCPCLRGSKAEGCSDGVRPLTVLQHQPPVLGQGKVVTCGQVTQSKRLAPANVAPTPAVKVTAINKMKHTSKQGENAAL